MSAFNMDRNQNNNTENTSIITSEQTTNDSNDTNFIKFGEILFNKNKNENEKLHFSCNFCENFYSEPFLLINHIIKNHYFLGAELNVDSLKESFLINNSNQKLKNSELENLEGNFLNDSNEKKSSLFQSENENSVQFETNYEENKKKKKVRLLNGDSNWQCHLCNIVLKCTSKYDHLKRHGGKIFHKCNYCDEKFSTKVRRRNHEKQHTGESERPIKCNNCSKSFKSKVILKAHYNRDHLGIRDHKCDYCNKSFYLKVEKISHERSNHTKEKPCICEFCGLCFTVQQKLNIHMQNHDEPKFQCDKCNKYFFAKANLKKHQICHSNLKPFICEICNAKFPRLCAYKTHLKLHSNVKEYICRFCGKDYHDISGISCHMKTTHGLQYNKLNVIRRSQKRDNENQ